MPVATEERCIALASARGGSVVVPVQRSTHSDMFGVYHQDDRSQELRKRTGDAYRNACQALVLAILPEHVGITGLDKNEIGRGLHTLRSVC